MAVWLVFAVLGRIHERSILQSSCTQLDDLGWHIWFTNLLLLKDYNELMILRNQTKPLVHWKLEDRRKIKPPRFGEAGNTWRKTEKNNNKPKQKTRKKKHQHKTQKPNQKAKPSQNQSNHLNADEHHQVSSPLEKPDVCSYIS